MVRCVNPQCQNGRVTFTPQCDQCYGRGIVPQWKQPGNPNPAPWGASDEVTCQRCLGSGHLASYQESCSRCGGQGEHPDWVGKPVEVDEESPSERYNTYERSTQPTAVQASSGTLGLSLVFWAIVIYVGYLALPDSSTRTAFRGNSEPGYLSFWTLVVALAATWFFALGRLLSASVKCTASIPKEALRRGNQRLVLLLVWAAVPLVVATALAPAFALPHWIRLYLFAVLPSMSLTAAFAAVAPDFSGKHRTSLACIGFLTALLLLTLPWPRSIVFPVTGEYLTLSETLPSELRALTAEHRKHSAVLEVTAPLLEWQTNSTAKSKKKSFDYVGQVRWTYGPRSLTDGTAGAQAVAASVLGAVICIAAASVGYLWTVGGVALHMLKGRIVWLGVRFRSAAWRSSIGLGCALFAVMQLWRAPASSSQLLDSLQQPLARTIQYEDAPATPANYRWLLARWMIGADALLNPAPSSRTQETRLEFENHPVTSQKAIAGKKKPVASIRNDGL